MTNKKVQEGLGELADMAERDHEVQMARAQLYKLAKYSIKLHDMLKQITEAEGLEGWQQAKITKASDYISSVYHSLEYDMKFGNGEVAEGKSPHKKGTEAYNESTDLNSLRKFVRSQREAPDQVLYQMMMAPDTYGHSASNFVRSWYEKTKEENGLNDVDSALEIMIDELGLNENFADGKKKGTKAYKKHMAAMHAESAKDEYKSHLRAKLAEKSVSKAQQQAAGIALAAKRKGETPKGKGAAASMAKMPAKELEKFAGTKHKGLPKHKK